MAAFILSVIVRCNSEDQRACAQAGDCNPVLCQWLVMSAVCGKVAMTLDSMVS